MRVSVGGGSRSNQHLRAQNATPETPDARNVTTQRRANRSLHAERSHDLP
jgi:hypothetical protein